MKTTKLAQLFFSILALSSCGDSNLTYEKHCKTPPSNWITEDEHVWADKSGSGVDPIIYLVSLQRSGRLNWNGYPINKADLKGRLLQADKLDGKPLIILKIENETPCSHVEEVRRTMLQSETCQASEKYCTEHSSFFTGGPPEEGTMEQRK